MGFLGTPLGYILYFLYQFISNYGLLLIVFSVLVKFAMFPLTLKQKKSSIIMNAFRPKMDAINKKFAKDPKRKQEEVAKLYQEEGYNPMAGCLPVIIQLVLLFGIIDVVYKPLTHLVHMSQDMINKTLEVANKLIADGLIPNISAPLVDSNGQSTLIGIIQNPQFSSNFSDILGSEMLDKVMSLDLSFLGMNLGETPTFAMNWLIIIPALSGVTSFLSMYIIRKLQKKTMPSQEDVPGAGMLNSMMYIMPIFSIFIAFAYPIGLGIYWIVGNILSIVTEYLATKICKPEKVTEAFKQKQSRKKEMFEKYGKPSSNTQNKDNNSNSSNEISNISQKELDRKRLAAARKRDAEFYGDEYSSDVSDDELK